MRFYSILILAFILLTGCRSVVVGDSVGAMLPADANYAAPGAAISDVTRQLETDPTVRDAVPGSDLTISVGGNDVFWYGAAYLFSGHWANHVWIAAPDERALQTGLTQFRADWQRMADAADTLAPRHVVALTIYNPYVSVTDATARRYLRDLNDWIAADACARGWAPARVDLAFNGDGNSEPGALLGTDGLHPSDMGMAVIEREIQSAHC